MLEIKYVNAIKDELNACLSGGKIDAVSQPSKDLLIITVRAQGQTLRLLLCVSPSYARAHITRHEYEKPSEPPMFCMLLRKHITGAVIESVERPVNDRVLKFNLNYCDEFGKAYRESLIIEMIPGKMNVILVGEDGIIIDCIYRRGFEPEMYRRNFPGMIYHFPKPPEGFEAPKEEKFESSDYGSLSEFLDEYYYEREKKELLLRRTKELRTHLTSAQKRITKKLVLQRAELKNTESREKFRHMADLITANIYRIKKGDKSLICEDFYKEGSPITEIPLDELKSPQDNAKKYYKEYSKLKTAEGYLTELIIKGEAQLDYIESALDELSRSESNRDIEGIKAELIASGILKDRNYSKRGNKNSSKSKKPQPKAQINPLKLETKNGLDILIGRNNLENDELTFKVARKTDIWFHVKDIHGSHVILKTAGSSPEERDILEAAKAAKDNSKARDAQNVEVDYTDVRYVKKPAGALPGKVIYTNQKTVIIK